MTFSERSWQERQESLGDLAEGVFEDVCERILRRGYVRYGLSRPPIQMHTLPARVRYSPDYLMSGKFVEVQGFGRDQTFKLKLDKFGCLSWWNDLLPVDLFIFDSQNSRWQLMELHGIDSMLGRGVGELKFFPEGKPYFAFPATHLPNEWTDYDGPERT